MTEEEKQSVLDLIEVEGFDYGICEFELPEIKDRQFHILKNHYILASNNLKKYLGINN